MSRGRLRPASSSWINVVEDYFNSGLRPSVYCRQKCLPVSTLSTWRKRYKKKVESTSAGTNTFQKVRFSETVLAEPTLDSPALSGITLHIDDKIKISLDRSFDCAALIKALRILRDELC